MSSEKKSDMSDYWREYGNMSSTRGHNQKLIKPRANKDIRKNYFTNRVINNWNSLPDYVINSKTVKIFEKNLDNYFNEKKFDIENL